VDSSADQVTDGPSGIGQESTSGLHRQRIVVGDRLERPVVGDLQDPGVGDGQQDRRVRRDQELTLLPYEVVDPRDGGQATAGGQRRLGLVEQVEAVVVEAVDQQVEERLPVRAGVRGDAAVPADEPGAARALVQPLDLRRDVVERFRPQEVGALLPPGSASQPQGAPERGLARARREAERAGAALRVEPERDGDALDQRRLPRPVLPDEERDARAEGQPRAAQAVDDGQVERMALPGGLLVEGDVAQEPGGSGQRDEPIVSSTFARTTPAAPWTAGWSDTRS
jgi:hypothetical protein